ncbi:hypothetical protein PMIN01_08101 [Paraphaeosphaeria minitans]|uniref:Uncharacterized protein n=1 Tax=Paraphaeosphaeria minitans TaxID=565426 RepID=A0A9P6GED7_9PLEO|nr:hypothetical protein PMIN01_08101 [Paraphaeosphaeria minitans]
MLTRCPMNQANFVCRDNYRNWQVPLRYLSPNRLSWKTRISSCRSCIKKLRSADRPGLLSWGKSR